MSPGAGKIVTRDDCAYCVVVAGVQLIMKVTPTSVRTLELKPGADVVCLFKAHSVKVE